MDKHTYLLTISTTSSYFTKKIYGMYTNMVLVVYWYAWMEGKQIITRAQLSSTHILSMQNINLVTITH